MWEIRWRKTCYLEGIPRTMAWVWQLEQFLHISKLGSNYDTLVSNQICQYRIEILFVCILRYLPLYLNFSLLTLLLPYTIVGLNIMPTRRNIRRSWVPSAVISRQDSLYIYVYNRLNSRILSIRPAASQRYHTIPKWRTSYNNKNSENENENNN